MRLPTAHDPEPPRPLIRILKSLAESRKLLRDFVARDLRARYVGSSLGFFWSVVNPIMNLAVYVFVFQIVLKTTWGPDMGSGEVVLQMLVGIVAWSAFAEGISRSTGILVDNASMIQKVVFPSAVLPAYVTISALINMIIALPVVGIALGIAMANPPTDPATVAAAAASGNEGVQVGLAFLSVPLLLALQSIFTLGLAYFLAAFNLFWRDTFHVIGVLLMVWMFITPIFYPPFRMAEKGYGWLLDYNPMHWLMDMYRGAMVKNTFPDGIEVLRFGLAAVVVFALGSTFFASQRKRFADLL